MKRSQLLVCQNSTQLSQVMAEHLARQAILAIQKRGRFLVVLSGGNTPLESYRILAQEPLRQSIPWDHVHFFWGDERYVSYNDPQSNFGQAKRTFIDRLDVLHENLNPIPTNCPPEESAIAYNVLLLKYALAGQKYALFDLVLFGLGNDGHIASLFPGQSALWKEPVIPVQANYQGTPSTRITMTPLALNYTREAIFIVSGNSKASALKAALEFPADVNRFPSHAISPRKGKSVWMADSDAASELSDGLV
ncbi:MAG: 6-phosphogluconolactonase [Chloroflexota bacterium]